MDTNNVKIIAETENILCEKYRQIDEIVLYNQEKVLNAFQKNKVSARHLSGTTGYGYDDVGRDTLCRLFADIFGAENAIVSPLITSGTHALTIALFGLLRPSDIMLSITGKPYDTLDEVILGENNGSLRDFGIQYRQIELKNSALNLAEIAQSIKENKPKVIFMQRSQGYAWREPLDIAQIAEIKRLRDEFSPQSYIVVDNCYGEFTGKYEPTEFGADVIIGSLIKNAGGGMAVSGAYVAGTNDAITKIGYRLTSAGLGTEVGSYAYGYLPFYQGVFMAPKIVGEALKGSMLAGKLFANLGYETNPSANAVPKDIIRAIKFGDESKLLRFCKIIQAMSPIDSYVVPEPWDMPGYNHKVIMSAGTFVQGGSLELTADAPIKEPYIGYLQGGLTYEHIKLALDKIITEIKS